MKDYPKKGKSSQNKTPLDNKQKDKQIPMEEEKEEKFNQNQEDSALPTVNSIESINQIEPLNTSININLKIKKEDNIYTYSKEYYDELYANLLLEEKNHYEKINCNYMSNQNEINTNMRAILIDWLIDIHFRLNMKKKTLFASVFIIDAFLSKKTIERKYLQLLGLAALLIASKQFEIIYPSIQTFLGLSGFAFTDEELTKMEMKIIYLFNFDILAPTAEEFFAINSEYFKFNKEQIFFGEYILDTSLLNYKLLKYKQSTIGVACGYLVMKCFHLNGTDLILDNTYKDVSSKDVKDCARELYFTMKNISNSSFQATKNKYMSDQFMNVALYADNI